VNFFATKSYGALNGIQEVSGSIPLISTKGYDKRLVFLRKQAFPFSITTYRDEVGTIHRHSSILSPADKGRFHVQKIVKAAFFAARKYVSP